MPVNWIWEVALIASACTRPPNRSVADVWLLATDSGFVPCTVLPTLVETAPIVPTSGIVVAAVELEFVAPGSPVQIAETDVRPDSTVAPR